MNTTLNQVLTDDVRPWAVYDRYASPADMFAVAVMLADHHPEWELQTTLIGQGDPVGRPWVIRWTHRTGDAR